MRSAATDPTVLLIDEIDKTDVEVEALLLEVLSDFQVTIPEMGTVAATRRPFVVLTSNANRELSEALKRRCLYLYLDYPSPERERDILLERVPGLERDLAEQVARAAATLRTLDLRKSPSLAESIDWARTLLALGIDNLDGPAVAVDARRRAQARRPTTPARSRNSTCPPSANESRRPAPRVRRRAARRRGWRCRSPRTSTPRRRSARSTCSTASRCATRTPPRW